MPASRRVSFTIALAMLVGLLVPAVAAAAPGGNADAAHACQQGGFLDWTRDDGTAFKNAGQCASYVARGGTLTSPVSVTATVTIVEEVTESGYCFLSVQGENFDPETDYTATESVNGAPVAVYVVTTDGNGTFSIFPMVGNWVTWSVSISHGGTVIASSDSYTCQA
jgi:hypothetical protein